MFALLMLTPWLSVPAAAQELPSPAVYPVSPTITVTGEATTRHTPDQVTLPVTIYTENAVLNKAKEENDRKLQIVLNLAREHGIPKEKLQTAYTSIEPRYDYSDNKQVFRGYVANTMLNITLTDVSRLGAFMQALVDAKIDRLGSVSFTLQNDDKAKSDTLLKALANAKAKADGLSAAAGQKLGNPLRIVEGSADMMPPPPMPYPMMAKAAMAEDARNAGAQLPSGLIEVRQNVTVTYTMSAAAAPDAPKAVP